MQVPYNTRCTAQYCEIPGYDSFVVVFTFCFCGNLLQCSKIINIQSHVYSFLFTSFKSVVTFYSSVLSLLIKVIICHLYFFFHFSNERILIITIFLYLIHSFLPLFLRGGGDFPKNGQKCEDKKFLIKRGIGKTGGWCKKEEDDPFL